MSSSSGMCLMEGQELDERIKALPPNFGVRHFKKGWSKLAQVSGGERKDMARILLGCIIRRAPTKVIICFGSKHLYLTNKDVLVDLGICDHLNIPKFHSMVFSGFVAGLASNIQTFNQTTECLQQESDIQMQDEPCNVKLLLDGKIQFGAAHFFFEIQLIEGSHQRVPLTLISPPNRNLLRLSTQNLLSVPHWSYHAKLLESLVLQELYFGAEREVEVDVGVGRTVGSGSSLLGPVVLPGSY
ncbi:hypothetical protein DFJ58DRAFT_836035 [Suillus subalutaceus]|uniref:uncharacterized protein n=1 Tax=Suillus subalutaceus TaxID=48586 RepID=UPI001B8723B3|nr:uncharacterized protein DFJ58DRAFT_836035 [Suillus subalutaceus]KAG1875397.1 hypothetical protein DFJ58DRAFT_836035 [Suillus subalutaceus]